MLSRSRCKFPGFAVRDNNPWQLANVCRRFVYISTILPHFSAHPKRAFYRKTLRKRREMVNESAFDNVPSINGQQTQLTDSRTGDFETEPRENQNEDSRKCPHEKKTQQNLPKWSRSAMIVYSGLIWGKYSAFHRLTNHSNIQRIWQTSYQQRFGVFSEKFVARNSVWFSFLAPAF